MNSNDQIQQIERDVIQLKELQDTLHELVHHQQPLLDSIEDHIEPTEQLIKESVQELETSQTSWYTKIALAGVLAWIFL